MTSSSSSSGVAREAPLRSGRTARRVLGAVVVLALLVAAVPLIAGAATVTVVGGNYTEAGAVSVAVDGTATTPVAGTDYDQIAVAGDVTLEATATLAVVFSGTAPAAGTEYRIIDNQGTNPVSGTFSGLAEGAWIANGGQTFRISYAGGTGNDVTLTAIAAQATLTVVATSPATYGSTQTLDTTGGSGGGTVTYSTGASTACSVSGTTLTITAGAGTCSVTATKAAAGDYLEATSSATDVTVNPAEVVVTPLPVTLTYGDPAPSSYGYSVSGFLGTDSWTPITATPTCTSTYSPGSDVGTYAGMITCSGGTTSADYTVTYGTASLTVTPFALEPAETWYTGQTFFYTNSASQTARQVTLTASITAYGLVTGDDGSGCTVGGPSVTGGLVTFRDSLSGKVLAKNVPISEVGGNCEEGIATTFATLSTGNTGAQSYIIVVEAGGSLDGTNNGAFGQIDTDPASATVVVSTPPALGAISATGLVDYLAASSSTSLGTEGSLTSAMVLGDSASLTAGFVPGTKKVSAKGQAYLVIPGPGGTYYVKSNAVTSVTTSGGETGTVYTKASVWMIPIGCADPACQVSMEGNASLRLDVKDTGDLVGVTIQSSKTSALLYSNDWRKESKAWKTFLQAIAASSGTVDVG
ncbi:MAG: hypothetical protein ACKOA9_10425 [Actinomycetota bacterium]